MACWVCLGWLDKEDVRNRAPCTRLQCARLSVHHGADIGRFLRLHSPPFVHSAASCYDVSISMDGTTFVILPCGKRLAIERNISKGLVNSTSSRRHRTIFTSILVSSSSFALGQVLLILFLVCVSPFHALFDIGGIALCSPLLRTTTTSSGTIMRPSTATTVAFTAHHRGVKFSP